MQSTLVNQVCFSSIDYLLGFTAIASSYNKNNHVCDLQVRQFKQLIMRSPKMASYNQRSQQTKRLKLSVTSVIVKTDVTKKNTFKRQRRREHREKKQIFGISLKRLVLPI
ncbi:hypothetical protein [Nostoc sp.]|uniref:hypothetical protein n=1 Tax=Nostoc sp. TaxID=1180 RepID=UPI002FF7430A